MKIVIDIDEKEYKRIINGDWIGNQMAEIFENGTVLPDNHGRLIDADNMIADLLTIKSEQYADLIEWACNIADSQRVILEATEGTDEKGLNRDSR